MNDHKLQWARQHDWFISGNYQSITVRDDMVADRTITFTDFTKLYDWAGY